MSTGGGGSDFIFPHYTWSGIFTFPLLLTYLGLDPVIALSFSPPISYAQSTCFFIIPCLFVLLFVLWDWAYGLEGERGGDVSACWFFSFFPPLSISSWTISRTHTHSIEISYPQIQRTDWHSLVLSWSLYLLFYTILFYSILFFPFCPSSIGLVGKSYLHL